jgi:hypothetical protein
MFQDGPKQYVVTITPHGPHRYLEPYEIAEAIERGEPWKFGASGNATVEVRPA